MCNTHPHQKRSSDVMMDSVLCWPLMTFWSQHNLLDILSNTMIFQSCYSDFHQQWVVSWPRINQYTWPFGHATLTWVKHPWKLKVGSSQSTHTTDESHCYVIEISWYVQQIVLRVNRPWQMRWTCTPFGKRLILMSTHLNVGLCVWTSCQDTLSAMENVVPTRSGPNCDSTNCMWYSLADPWRAVNSPIFAEFLLPWHFAVCSHQA